MGFAMPNPSQALLINLLGVGNDPIQSLSFGSEAVDTALVARVISYDNVPTRSFLVLEGQHYRFFFGVCHLSTMHPACSDFQFSLYLPYSKEPTTR